MNKYTRMNWENTPSTATPLTADNLNHMDEGIEQATDGVTAVEEALKTATSDLTTVKSEVETARGSSSSLNARLNGIDSSVTNKAEKSTVSQLSARMQTAETSLAGKANATDVANALRGKEDNANKVSSKTDITDSRVNYPSIEYLDAYYYKANELYSSEEMNELLGEKADKVDVDTSLANKANRINSSNIFDFSEWAKGLQNLTNPVYRGTLNNVDYNEKTISLTTTEKNGYTNGWTSPAPQSMRIAVKPNTKYLFSWLPSSTNCGAFVFLNGINTADARFELKKGFGSFTTAEDTTFISIRFDYYGTGFFEVSEIMIAEEESIYLPNKVAEGVIDVANEVLAFEKTTQASLDGKYDSSNIESGTSTLTPHSTVTDKIKNASCVYKKIGDTVIVNATLIMNPVTLGGNSIWSLIDLPFIHNSDTPLYFTGMSNKGNMFKGAIFKKSSWLSFQTLNKTQCVFTDSEQINFSLIYRI